MANSEHNKRTSYSTTNLHCYYHQLVNGNFSCGIWNEPSLCCTKSLCIIIIGTEFLERLKQGKICLPINCVYAHIILWVRYRFKALNDSLALYIRFLLELRNFNFFDAHFSMYIHTYIYGRHVFQLKSLTTKFTSKFCEIYMSIEDLSIENIFMLVIIYMHFRFTAICSLILQLNMILQNLIVGEFGW